MDSFGALDASMKRLSLPSSVVARMGSRRDAMRQLLQHHVTHRDQIEVFSAFTFAA
jgi:hypothetical protein